MLPHIFAHLEISVGPGTWGAQARYTSLYSPPRAPLIGRSLQVKASGLWPFPVLDPAEEVTEDTTPPRRSHATAVVVADRPQPHRPSPRNCHVHRAAARMYINVASLNLWSKLHKHDFVSLASTTVMVGVFAPAGRRIFFLKTDALGLN